MAATALQSLALQIEKATGDEQEERVKKLLPAIDEQCRLLVERYGYGRSVGAETKTRA